MLPSQRLQKSNTIDNLWLYILSLAKKTPIYAYQIPKNIKEKFRFKPGKITPYRVLYKLEHEGFVKSKLEQRRRFYEITAKGKEELKKAKDFYIKMIKLMEE